jgi:hypothetical protein
LTFTRTIALLDTIPGVDRRGAERWVAETGIDMVRFGTAARLAAWVGVAPGNDESAGKQRSGRTRHGNQPLRTVLTQLDGHDGRREWFKSVTEAFLKDLARGRVPRPSKRGEAKPQRLSQSTIARTYATVPHFACWIHKHVVAFPLGCPTDGVKAPEEREPKWKGLSRLEQLRVLGAAQALGARTGRGTAQGLRDHALIATLLDPTRSPSAAADPHSRLKWRLGGDLPRVVSRVPYCSPADSGMTPQDQTLSM